MFVKNLNRFNKKIGVKTMKESRSSSPSGPLGTPRAQAVLQLLVAAYLFYLVYESLRDLAAGALAIPLAVVVGSCLLFGVCALFLTVRNVKILWQLGKKSQYNSGFVHRQASGPRPRQAARSPGCRRAGVPVGSRRPAPLCRAACRRPASPLGEGNCLWATCEKKPAEIREKR